MQYSHLQRGKNHVNVMTNRLRRHTISFLPQTGPSYSKRPLIVFYERIKVREHTIEEGKFLKEKLICFSEYTNNCLNNISEIIPMHIVCNTYSRLKFEKKCNFGKLQSTVADFLHF